MARLRREAIARMLGNGLCTRSAELDCRMESACETCVYFRTGTEFLPILVRQRDHARDHGQPAYNTGTLCADLHRFAFLLGASDGEELFGERHHDHQDRPSAPHA